MTDFDANDALADEDLEARAREGDITACFTLINRIDRVGGDDRDVWGDFIEAKFEAASPWEIAEDLASAYTELVGELPREWLDDARACAWLLSADGMQALAHIREELQPEPSLSDDGVWTVRTNDEVSQEIDRSGRWVALTKLAPTALGGDMPRVPRSTLLDQVVEFGTLIPEPWPMVVQRAEAGDLTAWALLATRPQFENTYDNAADVDFDPDLLPLDDVGIDDEFLGAVATAFSKNRFLLTDSWEHVPEVCELVTGLAGHGVFETMVRSMWDFERGVPAVDINNLWSVMKRGGWHHFAHTADELKITLSDGTRLPDARVGVFKKMFDDYVFWTVEVWLEQPPFLD